MGFCMSSPGLWRLGNLIEICQLEIAVRQINNYKQPDGYGQRFKNLANLIAVSCFQLSDSSDQLGFALRVAQVLLTVGGSTPRVVPGTMSKA